MTFSAVFRPVLVCLIALTTASCGMVESDPHRFEGLARRVADIPLDGADTAGSIPVPTRVDQGLRPAGPSTRSALRVEVMDPHDLWDARDAGLRGAIERAGPALAEAAAPAVAGAVIQRVSQRVAEAAPMRPAIARAAPGVSDPTATIQLGAYSSVAAARSAWNKVSAGPAQSALTGLSPVFETVEVNGRPFTRLKIAAPARAAASICRAAEITDPWCARRT